MRDDTLYARMTYAAQAGGVDVTTPQAGFWRFKLRSNGVMGGLRIWHGPPYDPETGEVLDRSWRWQAEFDGEPVDFDDVWPVCAKAENEITESEYHNYVARRIWAQRNAPKSAFADPKRRYDPLSTSEPLPF